MVRNLWKAILTNAGGGIVAAVLLLSGGAIWNTVTDGSLLRLLGAVDVQVGSRSIDDVPVPGNPPSTNSNELRTSRGRIDFPRPFASEPIVAVALNRLDTEKMANTRVSLEIRDITRTGFDYEVHTWLDTRVYSVGITWVAVAR